MILPVQFLRGNLPKINSIKPQNINWKTHNFEAVGKSKENFNAVYIESSRVVTFGPPPSISTIAKEVKHNKKIKPDTWGIAFRKAGHSIRLK